MDPGLEMTHVLAVLVRLKRDGRKPRGDRAIPAVCRGHAGRFEAALRSDSSASRCMTRCRALNNRSSLERPEKRLFGRRRGTRRASIRLIVIGQPVSLAVA